MVAIVVLVRALFLRSRGTALVPLAQGHQHARVAANRQRRKQQGQQCDPGSVLHSNNLILIRFVQCNDLCSLGATTVRGSSPRARGPGEVFQYRAVRPAVAVAVVRQVLERRHHRLHFQDPALQILHVAAGNLLYRGARPRFVLPQRQQFADVFHGKAQRARTLGFAMDDIRELLALWQNKSRPSASVKKIAGGHLQDLTRRIQEMQSMVTTLKHLTHNCHGDSRPDCPILEDLAGP